MTLRERAWKWAIVAAGLAAIATAYHASANSEPVLRKILQFLFFLPGVVAALWFGWKGGVPVAFAAAISYVPLSWPLSVEQFSESFDLLLIGCIMGILGDRERRRAKLLEKTTEQLTEAYARLQDNVERWKHAERLSAIGQLSAGLAHEIRTPLAAIEGAAELLRSVPADDDLRTEMTEILRKESKRLNRLLTDLLQFARPRRPEFRLAMISQVVESVVRLLDTQARKAGVVFAFRCEPGVPEVECDPEQLRQVLLNLCINALQAAKGGGAVEIAAAARGASAIITVADNGPGMPPEVAGRIFEPFFTTKPDGTGLGLAVARTIVEGHGGRISLEPNVPSGVRFHIELPVSQKESTDERDHSNR